jgi:Protein of unknown function (DUF3108)
MNRRFPAALGICVAALGVWAGSAGVAENHAPLPFSPGETLTYDVNWSVFPAGQVAAALIAPPNNSPDEYEVKTTATSKGVVSLLYNVQDEFHSFFNAHTLCSERISKKINEGRRHKETEIKFDYARGLAILDERDLNKPKGPAKHEENSIPACVEDVVSAFYFLRSQPLQIGREIKLAINDGAKTSDVVVEVQGREQVQTGLGMRQAIRVEPKVFGGLYKRKGRMLIWLSDDSQRLPLRIKMMISVGSITGTLAAVNSSAEKSSPAGP